MCKEAEDSIVCCAACDWSGPGLVPVEEEGGEQMKDDEGSPLFLCHTCMMIPPFAKTINDVPLANLVAIVRGCAVQAMTLFFGTMASQAVKDAEQVVEDLATVAASRVHGEDN